MDVERALVSTALSATGGVLELISRGITPELFSATPAGQQCSEVLRFCVDYTRQYGQQPPLATVQRFHPTWHIEFAADPLPALSDEFLDTVRKRYFDSIVLRLSHDYNAVEQRRELDTVLLDAAREMASVIPSGRVARFKDQMESRIAQYEVEANSGYRPTYELGIPIIDEVMGGMRPGWLATFAGFSGLGKTTLGLLSSLNIFEQDHSALFLSLEMSAAEVMERLDTMVNHFPHRQLVQRELAQAHIDRWRNVTRVYKQAAGEIVVVDRLGGCTIDRIHAEIARYRPQVAFVDYVQRMSGTRHSMAKWEGLEEITNELKTIAMDTDTAIVMISQDGRAAAEEGSTRTNMGGSISVYQAADVYIGMMQSDEMRSMQKMRAKMLKFRHGPLAEVDMSWQPATGEFGKWDDSDAFVKPPALRAVQ